MSTNLSYITLYHTMVKNRKGFKKPNVNKRVETVEKS